MSSISVTPTVSPPTNHHTHSSGGVAQHYNYNQTPHNGEAVHTGTTHSNASSLGSLPQSQHIGQNVNTTA
ncbi:MAG TPA: hypothetical protein VMQ11_06005 [Alphaproteobacteria bacterium]|nr:hypothetical protein [Alphaproteobacteria bacterium]